MLEIPEAQTLAIQASRILAGKRIAGVIAAHTGHKFAWYHGGPEAYAGLLEGKSVVSASACGGMVEIIAGSSVLVFSDGVNLRFHSPAEKRPVRHQLLINFEDGSSLSAVVQMYGGLLCFPEGSQDNPYYEAARRKPSPLTGEFGPDYFAAMIKNPEHQKLSLKAFLATEQRIPGLGNGVLQDILYHAGLHPKRKVRDLDEPGRTLLFSVLKETLAEMTRLGGRDTEKDLFGLPGGYQTRMSKNHTGQPCPRCQGLIKKETYMGGSIYYCEGCQTL